MGALAFTACTSDDLVDSVQQTKTKSESLNFVMKKANATRSTTAMNFAQHYEFGVFAGKGTADITASGQEVMKNYLVAYATQDNAYKDYTSYHQSTWSAASGNSTTVDADGLSAWVYESLGYKEIEDDRPTGITQLESQTKAFQEAQILKYWDQAYNNTYFFAYTPYQQNGANITYIANGDDKANFKYSSLSAFYTYPARTDYQVATAITQGKQVANKGFDSSSDFKADNGSNKANNDEIINANEALYAATPVAKANYGNDVPLTFSHVNAKINVAFYEEIKGYSAELIDLVPKNITSGGTVCAARSVDGIAFTPATQEQALTPLTVTQPAKADLPKYFADEDITVYGIGGNNVIYMIEGKDADKVNTDLYFDIVNGGKDTKSNDCIATTKAYALTSTYLLPTTYYALPNYQNNTWLYSGASEIGYTLHVSYKLHPADGSADIVVYDARVYVPADKCKWEAGKAYTYIFKITKNTNGTTDPHMVDPATNSESYVDEEDPRVPETPALVPIVFDGVEITDYEAAPTGQTDDTWDVTDKVLTDALTAAVNSSSFTYTYGGSFYLSQDNLILNTTTGDFKYDKNITDETNSINQNNFFQNLKKFFAAIPHDEGEVEYIYYNGNYYKFGTSTWNNIGSDRNNPQTGGASIESKLATNILTSNANLPTEGGTVEDYFTLVGAESTLKVNFTANIKPFLTAALTSAKPNPLNSNGYIEVDESNADLPIVTLFAKADDVKWTGWPLTTKKVNNVETINTNDNNFYKDLKTYLENLYSYGVEKITYDSKEYTWADNNFKNADASLQTVLATAGYQALLQTANKGETEYSLTLNGTYVNDVNANSTALTRNIKLKAKLTDWNDNVFEAYFDYHHLQ